MMGQNFALFFSSDEHLKTETNYTLTLKEISEELDRETKRTAVFIVSFYS